MLFLVSVRMRLAVLALVAASAVACSGSVATVPVSQAPSAAFSTTAGVGVTLPTIVGDGITVNGTLPSASASSGIIESVSTSAPGGVPALTLARTGPLGARSPQSQTGTVTIAYVQLLTQQAVAFAAGGTLSFTISQPVAGVTYYLAEDAPSGWIQPVAGPGTISGTTVTVRALPAFTILPGSAITFALYSVASAASPAPSPTASPTPAPVALAPASLAFTATGAAAAQTVTAGQYGNTSFNATTPNAGQTGSCSGIAVISATGATFTVTPVAAGTCTFTITGASAQSATLSVVVTTTAIGGQ